MNTLKFGNGEWYGKKDTILAYNDENSNYKPLPFSFDRASSATVINKDGLIETVGSGEPRIDYKDDSKGALLLEPQRSNNLLQSNQFDTNWIGSSTSVLSGYLGLDGTNSAWLLTKTASSFANIRQNITFSGIHTFSVYLKKGTNTSAILRSTGGNDAKVEINLIDGTTSGETNTIAVETKSMGNDWWRCSMTLDASSNTAVRIYPEAPLGGVTAGNIYIQYAQLEQGSYATSYIPTQGGAVTRVAESCSQTPPSGIIGQTEGTLFVDFNIDTGQGIGGIIELINPLDTSSRLLLWDATALNNNINLVAFFSAKSDSITLNNVSVGNHKAVLIYNNSFTKFFFDGVKIGEQVSNNPYSNMNKIDFNNAAGSVNFQQKRIKGVKLYNTALTDQEAITLTTI